MEPARRAPEPAERAPEPAGRAPEPAGRAPELAGRALELAGTALEPAGKPGDNWEAREGDGEKKQSIPTICWYQRSSSPTEPQPKK